MKGRRFIIPFAAALMLITGCARTPYRFAAAPAVTEAADRSPSPVPEADSFNTREYMTASAVRHPLVRHLDPRRVPRAGDVNALDEVPASSWYEPRLGFRAIAPSELLRGPEVIGPPELPLTVLRVKDKGSAPGFTVLDSRGYRYLIKFDNMMAPHLETTADYVVNRLFWGFGYHVPEDHVVTFRPDDLKIGTDSEAAREDVDNVLVLGLPLDDGSYRVTASLVLSGTILGVTSQLGTREGDIHDTVPHENRRTLRALYVFASWLNHTGLRSDNTLDVYEGEAAEGHTVHYILDFGEAFGLHGLNYLRPWEGHEHFFDFDEMVLHYLDFGLRLRSWEKIGGPAGELASYFEAGQFDPAAWKESFQFQPARLSRADDNYWAAKIVAAVTREHVEALFDGAKHPDVDEQKYLIDTLMLRREKVIRYHFSRVTPLEPEGLEAGALTVRDEGFAWREENSAAVFHVSYYDDKHREAAPSAILTPGRETFGIPVPSGAIDAAGGYLRIEATAHVNGRSAPRPVEFHIRRGEDGRPVLAGVAH